MTQLPVDIWWIILKMVWKSISHHRTNLKDYNGKSKFAYRSILFGRGEKLGFGITNDLYMMRTLCKTTKKMVDKYSTRYVDGYEGENRSYYLIFPYEN
jgi:hypothetical protein